MQFSLKKCVVRLKQDSTDTSVLSVKFTWGHALRLFPFPSVGLKEYHREQGWWVEWQEVCLMDLKLIGMCVVTEKNEGNRC